MSSIIYVYRQGFSRDYKPGGNSHENTLRNRCPFAKPLPAPGARELCEGSRLTSACLTSLREAFTVEEEEGSHGVRNVHLLCTDLRTFYEDLRDFGVAGTKSAVDLEAVGVIEEGAAQREEDFLRDGREGEKRRRNRERKRKFSFRREFHPIWQRVEQTKNISRCLLRKV